MKISVRSAKQKFKVKCIAMDSNETMFVTGSADGDIKVHIKSVILSKCLSLSSSKPKLRCGIWPLSEQSSRTLKNIRGTDSSKT